MKEIIKKVIGLKGAETASKSFGHKVDAKGASEAHAYQYVK
ncbi:hypothetical protein ACFVFS_19995 [Kitasatospora sp. NPDC057692]